MTAPVPPPPRSNVRLIWRNGSRRITTIGRDRRPFTDLYHFLLTMPWPQLLLSVVSLYVTLNTIFALLYMAGAPCIQNARPNDFGDAFFFSVQTLATIGYGVMAPVTAWSHFLVTIEAFVGMLTVAMVTGLMFTKFSRPTARVAFSESAVIAPRNGVPTLQFRMSNQRANQIVEAKLQVALTRNERTEEGETMRRFHDLKLVRAQNMIFALSWTAMHEIDATSPLYGLTQESLKSAGFELVVSLVGTDETMAQPVHARWSYTTDEILWNHRFVDILLVDEKGTPYLDLRRFHRTEPLADTSGIAHG